MKLGFLKALRKRPRPAWMDGLTAEERRQLARNLRALLEPKRVTGRHPASARRK